MILQFQLQPLLEKHFGCISLPNPDSPISISIPLRLTTSVFCLSLSATFPHRFFFFLLLLLLLLFVLCKASPLTWSPHIPHYFHDVVVWALPISPYLSPSFPFRALRARNAPSPEPDNHFEEENQSMRKGGREEGASPPSPSLTTHISPHSPSSLFSTRTSLLSQLTERRRRRRRRLRLRDGDS